MVKKAQKWVRHYYTLHTTDLMVDVNLLGVHVHITRQMLCHDMLTGDEHHRYAVQQKGKADQQRSTGNYTENWFSTNTWCTMNKEFQSRML